MKKRPPRPRIEQCCSRECEEEVEAIDGQRCGGLLFGTRDDSGFGCGRFMCDDHLVGKSGPFYCHRCWAARKFSLGET